jgi:hypothetical protein
MVAKMKSGFARLNEISTTLMAETDGDQGSASDVSPFDRAQLMSQLYRDTSVAKTAAVVEYVQTLCRAGGKFLLFG